MYTVTFRVDRLNDGRHSLPMNNDAQGLFLYHSYERKPEELIG